MLKVLVVDDDIGVRMFMKRLLEKKFHFEVIEAENGVDALSLLKSQIPALIFLDITMPIMDGIETLEIIKKEEQFSEIPVVMLTAVGSKEMVSKTVKLGITDYILKPLVYERTTDRIREILDKCRINYTNLTDKTSNDKRNKILLIDPDEKFREIFRTLLKEQYLVIDSENGMSGLKMIYESNPDFVLIAENLTLLNEKLLLQKIVSAGLREKLKVFIYSEDPEKYSDPEKIFDGIIQKSLNPDSIIKGIKSYIIK